jgi:hypothetical protein
VWGIGTGLLRNIGIAGILYGLVTAAGALLAGPTREATAVRRWMAPVVVARPAVMWGVVAAAYLLLVLWGPTWALRKPWWILFFAALIALGVAMLRRQMVREFPQDGTVIDAPAPSPAPAEPRAIA